MDESPNLEQPGRQSHSPEGPHDPNQPKQKPSRVRQLMQRRPWLNTVGRILVLVLVAGAVGWWWNHRRYESTDDAQVDAYIYPVSARVSGQVTAVHAADGQFVKAGTPLAEIDDRDYQAALAKARGEYANAEATAAAAGLEVPVSRVGSTSQIRSAQAGVGTAKAGLLAAQKQVEEAQAQLARARASAQNANADVSRYGPLVEKSEISEQQYEQAVTAAAAADAAVAAGEATVRVAEEQVREAAEKIRQAGAGLATARATTMTTEAAAARAKSADARVAEAKAALQQAELNAGYTRIVAPTDGIVGRRTAQVGQNVEPGQELLTIVPTTDLWVTANFKETQLTRMRPGEPVDISVAGCGRTLKGRVTSIGGATGARFSLLPPENATGNYVKVVQRIPVRIDLERRGRARTTPHAGDGSDDDACLVRAGMSVVPYVKVR